MAISSPFLSVTFNWLAKGYDVSLLTYKGILCSLNKRLRQDFVKVSNNLACRSAHFRERRRRIRWRSESFGDVSRRYWLRWHSKCFQTKGLFGRPCVSRRTSGNVVNESISGILNVIPGCNALVGSGWLRSGSIIPDAWSNGGLLL